MYNNLSFDFIKCESKNEKDFCATHHAIGFPTLNFYIDGIFHEEYADGDDTAEFQAFIDEMLKTNSTCVQTPPKISLGISEELLN